MKNLITRITLIFTLALIFTFTACNKKDSSTDPEFAAEDNTNTNAASDDVIAVSENSMSKGDNSMGRLSQSRVDANITDDVYKATITITPKASPSDTGKIVIDFGSVGIKGNDGRTRTGKINIKFTGQYHVPGKVQIITLENYTVDGRKVEGKKVLTHLVVDKTYITNVIVTGAKLTYLDGTFTTWTSTRTRVWDPKGTLSDYSDDVVTVSGNINGVSRNNIAYSAIIDPIISPLVYTYACIVQVGLVPVSGKITITPANALPRIIDFGNGTCDRIATFNVAGKSIPFTIK